MSALGEDGTASGHGPEVVREATTMALYVSLSLLAVFVVLPVGNEDNRVEAGLTVLLTGIGLVLAHHVAFRVSSRLVNDGLLDPESVRALQAQALGGIPVAVLAAIPVFVLGESPGEEVSELLLVALVALVGYRAARQRATPLRALVYAGGLVVMVGVVIVVKLAAGH
jgi:hypothetical protein